MALALEAKYIPNVTCTHVDLEAQSENKYLQTLICISHKLTFKEKVLRVGWLIVMKPNKLQ